jgi:hypothetical protein
VRGKNGINSKRKIAFRITAKALFVCACFLLLAACAIPAASDLAGHPKRGRAIFVSFWRPPNGAAILVPVKINGQGPYTFVLDTGATFTCIDQKLVDQLKLPETRGQIGVGIVGHRGSDEIS